MEEIKTPAQIICNALGGDESANAVIKTQKILDALLANGWAFVHESEATVEDVAELVWNGICNAASKEPNK